VHICAREDAIGFEVEFSSRTFVHSPAFWPATRNQSYKWDGTDLAEGKFLFEYRPSSVDFPTFSRKGSILRLSHKTISHIISSKAPSLTKRDTSWTRRLKDFPRGKQTWTRQGSDFDNLLHYCVFSKIRQIGLLKAQMIP
jgi:hypothetical protein